VANQGPNGQKIAIEERADGFLFTLRDEVFLLVKWHSPTQLHVEVWRQDKLLPPDVGNLATSSFRARLTQAASDLFGAANVPNLAEDIGNVALILSSPTPGGKSMQTTLQEKSGPSVADRLILYARKSGRFFHNADRDAFASVRVGKHTENYPVRSKSFRLWLQNEFWTREKRKIEERLAATEGALFEGQATAELPEVVREQALGDAIGQVEALARFNTGAQEEVHIRVAPGGDGVVYIDLGDEDWRSVRIDRDGWRVVGSDETPVKFVRMNGMLPLPEPKRGGDAGQLRALLNLPEGEEGEKNWRLLLAWMSHAMLPFDSSGPYTMLVLLGPQGSAKTTAGTVIRNLIDPYEPASTGKPRDEHNVFIDAGSSWVMFLNNLSEVPGWLSDTLCRLTEGGGFKTRTLYENRNQELFKGARPVILTGISDVVTKGDLLDRSVIVNLERISDSNRRRERNIYEDARDARPEILGFLFSAMSAGLARVGDVQVEKSPRMADFNLWGIASEAALGGHEGSFSAAYTGARGDATQTALAAEQIAATLYRFAGSFKQERPWVGTTTELLAELNDRESDESLKRSRAWPKDASNLGRRLKGLAPSLAEVGVYVGDAQVSRRAGRKTQIYYSPPDGDSKPDGDTDAVTTGVTRESPIDKVNSPHGDGGDSGDGTITEGGKIEQDEDFGEV